MNKIQIEKDLILSKLHDIGWAYAYLRITPWAPDADRDYIRERLADAIDFPEDAEAIVAEIRGILA